MLPKELSNDICSLRPLEKRLTLVCEMILDRDCSLNAFKFYSAIIESKKRFTYDELSNLEKDDINKHPDFSNDLMKLLEICKKRIKKRKQRLAIDFEMNEYRPEIKKGKLKAFVPVTRYLSHKAVEECMILANISAAKFLKENKISTIFRFHDFPDMDKIITLQKFLQSRGLPVSEDFNLSRKTIFDWVQKTSKHKINQILALEILKSMKLAIYSSERSEHFALGLDEYLHFTSPIRRYPDLVVHRCIKKIIHNKKFNSLSKNDLADIAENCSFKEREADQISKEADKVLRSRCGQNYIGNKFSGIITGVTEFGVFVKLDQINIEGLCHISSFKNKYYNFNYEMKSLISRQGTISIGDKMSCIIESVHPYEGKISLIPA
jgi:ribonuclease R